MTDHNIWWSGHNRLGCLYCLYHGFLCRCKTCGICNISALFNPRKTCDIRFISQMRKGHFSVRLPTGRGRMATRNPSLGLTHHTYNRLQAGCYRTVNLDVKERVFAKSATTPFDSEFLQKSCRSRPCALVSVSVR